MTQAYAQPSLRRVLAGTLAGGLLFAASAADAQVEPTVAVSGIVVSAGDGLPVDRALVILRGGPEDHSDAAGRFAFPDLRPGWYEIAAVSDGCRTVRAHIRIERDEARILQLALPSPPAPPHAGRNDGRSGFVLTASELRSSRAPNLLEALRDHLPLSNAGSGRTRGFRGSGGSEVVLLVDGVRVADALEGLRSMRPEEVAHVEVHRSATAGTAYGPDAGGGLVIVTTPVGGPHQETPADVCRLPWEGRR